MKLRRFSVLVFSLAAAVIGSMYCLGCSGQDEPEQIAAHVNPYPTADSVLAEYNRIVMASPVDWNAMLAIMYPETEMQKAFLKLMTAGFRTAELCNLLKDRFGRLPPSMEKDAKELENMTNPNQEAAVMSRRLDRRAEATAKVQGSGKTETIQMVEIGGRWWISGYTTEQSFDEWAKKDLKRFGSSAADTELLTILGEEIERLTSDLIGRVQRGEITTIAQFESELKSKQLENTGRVIERIQKSRGGTQR